MATAIIDPSKARLFPEMLIEALSQDSITTGSEKVASYVLRDKHVLLEDPQVESTSGLDLIISPDGGERTRIRSNAVISTDARRATKIRARQTLDVSMQMASGSASNIWTRYNLTVRKPLTVDKLRYDMSLDALEAQVADSLLLEDHLSIGTIPYHESLLNIDPSKKFDEIIPVEKSMTALSAASEAVIGGAEITARPGELVVLLGVMLDTSIFATAVAPANDTYLVVERDGQPDYMKLDYTAMADGLYHKCYVPAVEKLRVTVESATGSGAAAYPAGFYYGTRKLGLADYVRWDLPVPTPTLRADIETLKAKQPRIFASIKAGVL
jgi:hypothetical protein